MQQHESALQWAHQAHQAFAAGDRDMGNALLDRAILAADKAGETRVALTLRTQRAVFNQDTPKDKEHLAQLLLEQVEVYRSSGQKLELLDAMINRGSLALQQKDLAVARQWLQEARLLLTAIRVDPLSEAHLLGHTSQVPVNDLLDLRSAEISRLLSLAD